MFTTLALLLAEAAAPESKPIPSLEEATTQIAEIDTELFWYAFEGCDAGKVRGLITDDFRMVHDLAGVVAADGDSFAAALKEGCDDREPGGKTPGYRNRRLLVPGSDRVTPLGDWGVLHRGSHTFHEWRGDQKRWEITGGGRFLNIYQWMPEEGRFRMQETLSLDHGAARSPVP